MLYYSMMVTKSVIMFLCVALAVGFYTLMERKVLAYIQLRKGPNKAGVMGLPQPLADAAKLFIKENPNITKSMKVLYVMSPVAATSIMFILWTLYTSPFSPSVMKLSLMFFIVVSSMNVYTTLLSGWASNSKYALLGAIRAIAQTISYEISMALVLMSVLLLSLTFNTQMMEKTQQPMWTMTILPMMMIMWMITALAETNRAPFDLAEGESELVSGFNIEYGGGEFALLFIAEYGSILFMSMLTACLFLGQTMTSLAGTTLMIKMMIIAYTFLWVRGSYPRMRYDVLMSLTWKTFLTITLMYTSILLTHNW